MTMQAFLIDAVTGETVQRMFAPATELEAFAAPEGLILVMLGEGAADIDVTETYLDGTLKIRTRTVDPEMDFAVARVMAREAVKTRRQWAESYGCATIKGRVDTTPDSQLKLNGAATMALIAKVTGQPFSLAWTMADNSTVTLSADEMIAVASAAGAHVSACHERARVLKAQIDAAQDQAALDAIDVESGWPDNVVAS